MTRETDTPYTPTGVILTPAIEDKVARGQGTPDEARAVVMALRRVLAMRKESNDEIREMPEVIALSDFPDVIPEELDEDALIKGGWLQRGGSAWLVSTAGSGKSIWATQFALCMSQGVPFSGLVPLRPLRCLVVQSEDSPARVAIDREDIVAGLCEAQRGKDRKNWRAACKGILFADAAAMATGAPFLETLDATLEKLKGEGRAPDVVIINPFLDFFGGDPTKAKDTTVFLNGGKCGGDDYIGLRKILKRHRVGALIVHHTGKTPSAKELANWIVNPSPEYQLNGSSFITNWARSIITMMKVPEHEGLAFITAAKNGNGLGWPFAEGARRIFLKWGDGQSAGGAGRRHFWRQVHEADELDECKEVLADVVKAKRGAGNPGKKKLDDTGVRNSAHSFMDVIAQFVNLTKKEIVDKWHERMGRADFPRDQAEKVVDYVFGNLPDGYTVREEKKGRSPTKRLVVD